MDRRNPLRAFVPLALALITLPAAGVDSLPTVAAGLQADAAGGRFGAARPLRVALASGSELTGQAEVQGLGESRCRSTVELVYAKPYEHRGVRITGLRRRSVQEGACAALARFVTEQVQREAATIETQVKTAASLAAAPAVAQPAVARRPDTLLSAPARKPAPAAVSQASYQLTVLQRAVVRSSPSFSAGRRALLPAGQVRLGRLVPGREGWYEILDLGSSGPAYIHESVVAQGPPAGRA